VEVLLLKSRPIQYFNFQELDSTYDSLPYWLSKLVSDWTFDFTE